MKTTALFGMVLLAVGCAHVKTQSSPMGKDRYAVTCDGNGYADTGDTIQCISKEAKRVCDLEGKDFEIIQGNTDTQLHVGVSPLNGELVPHIRPHSAAVIQCEDRQPASQ